MARHNDFDEPPLELASTESASTNRRNINFQQRQINHIYGPMTFSAHVALVKEDPKKVFNNLEFIKQEYEQTVADFKNNINHFQALQNSDDTKEQFDQCAVDSLVKDDTIAE